MVLFIILTVCVYSVIMVGLLTKLNDKRAIQLVQFIKRQRASTHQQNIQKYKKLVSAR
ncbi:hypothetical protein [Pontibacillus yanchengensis]|uniref:hypothetical protein n=1 Tax=Pontibacillus yanchengensis TaxID=462910 RepID=UPI000A731361|nr:hypothetical protein [Pontibacillus yanchengensis]